MRAGDLAAGGTVTCEACRSSSTAPTARRVIPENELVTHQSMWESVMIEWRSNLKRDAVTSWEEYGLPLFLEFIDRTELGRDFGWKCMIRDCHTRKNREAEVRVSGWHDTTRRFALGVRPERGPYWYEVDVTTGRTDIPWSRIRIAVETALDQLASARAPVVSAPVTRPAVQPQSPKSQAIMPTPSTNGTSAHHHPVPPAAPPAPPVSPPTSLASALTKLNIEQLVGMRGGLDTLISVSQDVKECEALKREAQTTLAARRTEAEPYRLKADAAGAVANRALVAASDAQEKVVRLQNELRDAMAERDRLATEADTQVEVRDRAFSEYAPHREAVEKAEREVVEAERLEAERLKAMGKADDLAPLLAALLRVPGAA
jgi:hypothetical protein